MNARQRIETVLQLDPHRGWHAHDLAQVTRTNAGKLYIVLAELEGDGRITGEWDDGPEPRRRLYRWNT